jgi:hypothetical protein
MSTLEVNTISPQSGTTVSLGGDLALNSNNITGTGNIPAANLTGALPAIDGSALTNLPGGGKVLQVVQTYKTNITTLGGTGSYQDISGLSVSITPTSASSKILFMCLLSIGTGGNTYAQAQVLRDSTAIGLGDVSGSRPRGTFSLSGSTPYYYTETRGCQILDEPNTTSAVTYKIQAQSASGVNIVINTSGEGYSGSHAVASSITVMEIGA